MHGAISSIINSLRNLLIESSRQAWYTKSNPARKASPQLKVCVPFNRRSFSSLYLLIPGVIITRSSVLEKERSSFVFFDDDGKKYLYHVRLTNGNRIFVAEMEDDFSAIKPATVKECITATEQWENTKNVPWSVTEGPTVLKNKGLYYMFYTANDFRNHDYAVGYATAKSPYGPWKKYRGGPIISRSLLGINGTGHGDFFRDKKNNLLYVFHTHFSDSTTGPRKTAIMKVRFEQDKETGLDKAVADKESFYFLRKEN